MDDQNKNIIIKLFLIKIYINFNPNKNTVLLIFMIGYPIYIKKFNTLCNVIF